MTRRNKERAKPDSWQTKPMPEARVRLRIDRTFSADDYAKLQRGFIPRVMEEKWFIYFEDGWLRFHRSWTGFCIFQLRLERSGNGYRVAEAWANRDRGQYGGTDEADEVALVMWLIDNLLLDDPGPAFDVFGWVHD